MSENKKYTIVIKRQRVEVSEAVYHAYHKEREAERYPDADIQVKGFEQTAFSDHFFDVMVGNVPFNSIKVDDPRYNKYNLPIHDYFVAKSLDKVRPGGMLALITSKFTMDKANSKMRRYIAGKAELIGAVRLPNNAFKQVAGTEATTDILFLKKREREIVPDEDDSSWLSVEQNADGIPMNSYFIDHPEMVLGEMVFDESMFGNEKTTACHPIPGEDLNERLERVISYLDGEYTEATPTSWRFRGMPTRRCSGPLKRKRKTRRMYGKRQQSSIRPPLSPRSCRKRCIPQRKP